jgi:DNA modification methylase
VKIEQRKIEALIPYVNNSRTHSDEQVAQIAASVREFGWTNPILVDGQNGIIAGHGRLAAARKLGLFEVPVIVLDHLSDAQKKALVIADNKLASNAGWDDEMLRLELGDLQEMGFDATIAGFTTEELDALLNVVEGTDGLTDEDDVPEAPEEPTTRLGDVWILGKHRLMCGDSTSIDAVEKLMDGQKADMVFTDPPYGVDYKGINNDNRDGLEELLRGSFGNYFSTSKSGASCYVFHSDKCADIFHQVFREFFHFSSIIVWAKNSLTLSRTDYQSQHEPCLYGWMKGGSHSFFGDRKQVSVWKFDKERVQGHTTPKPVALIERALQNSSKSDDVISDLFGGSGSTLIACEKTARQCRMMELDPKYCDVIVKRWQDFTGKAATHADTGIPFDSMTNTLTQ